MKNIIDVLKQKEAELQRLRNEVEVLRAATQLLSEEGDPRVEPPENLAATGTAPEAQGKPAAMGVVRGRQFP
jgi:hypothetical protein